MSKVINPEVQALKVCIGKIKGLEKRVSKLESLIFSITDKSVITESDCRHSVSHTEEMRESKCYPSEVVQEVKSSASFIRL